jgi:tetratricopeptide (TPR) repeat protein
VQEVGIQVVYGAIEEAFKAEDLDKVEQLLWPALDQFPGESRLWFYGGCIFFKRGKSALAAQLFTRAIDLDDSPHIYSNLGACYRRMNLHEQGLQVMRAALDRNPTYAPSLVNIGSMYVNEGSPEKGIPYLEKAMQIGGERGAIWNCGLLYLESARFGEGFDLYRQGITHERASRSYGTAEKAPPEVERIPEPALLTPEVVEEARASGRKPRVIVWGEQGIGDELMFGTIIEDMRQDFEVVFECHPRLEKLHRNAHPGLTIYPTRKDEWINWPISDRVIAEFKAPIGDLGGYYRRDLASFKSSWTGGTYRPKPEEVSGYQSRLELAAGSRPIVGLATRGGVMQTSRTYRTIRHLEIDRLMTETNALFVSLDYDDMLELASYIEDKYGDERFRWFPSITQHWDYHHTAALIGACDLVVTVCQSVFHISAGMGQATRVLTPRRCAWRYAPIPGEPELSYWYPGEQIKLYRQDDENSWQHPLDKVIADINGMTISNQEAAA